MNKGSTIKEKSIKRHKHLMPALVAEVVGCRPEYVNQVWRGSRRSEKKKGEAIEVATILLNECIETGIVNAKKIIGKVQGT